MRFARHRAEGNMSTPCALGSVRCGRPPRSGSPRPRDTPTSRSHTTEFRPSTSPAPPACRLGTARRSGRRPVPSARESRALPLRSTRSHTGSRAAEGSVPRSLDAGASTGPPCASTAARAERGAELREPTTPRGDGSPDNTAARACIPLPLCERRADLRPRECGSTEDRSGRVHDSSGTRSGVASPDDRGGSGGVVGAPGGPVGLPVALPSPEARSEFAGHTVCPVSPRPSPGAASCSARTRSWSAPALPRPRPVARDGGGAHVVVLERR